MNNKTHNKCGDCRHYFKCDSACEHDYACADFTPQGKTVFDRITASPEVLAPYLVSDDECGFHSSITDEGEREDIGAYDTEEEAIAATVARLKEVEK